MKLRLALIAATCLALPVAAHAQPVTGPYVSLGAGTTFLTSTNYSFNNGTSGHFLWRPALSGKVSAGYGFGNGFRVEIAGDMFRDTVHKADSAGSEARIFGGQRTYGMMVNGLYDVDVGWPIFPYVGAGIGYQWAKLNPNITDGSSSISGTEGSFAYDIIAGVAYPLEMVPGLSLTAEYQFMQLTASRNYRFTAPGSQVPTGTAKLGQESTHTFLIGLRYQIFNPPPPPPPAPVPVAAAPAPVPARTYLVFFDWDKYNLTPRATQIIAQAASDSKTQSTTMLDVSGYTDTSGTPVYNQGLSMRRAKAVAGQLVADGVPASEIAIHAYGETHLLVPTGPNVREPQNRRVEIIVK